MLKTIMVRSALIAFACAMSVAVHAYASDPKRFDVPAGDLTAALEALAKQSGVELVYQSDQLKGLRTRGVTGTLTAEEAVTKLLEGTPLVFRKDPSGAMLIANPKSSLATSQQTEVGDGSAPLLERGEGGARASGRVRLSQAEKPSTGTGEGRDPRSGKGEGSDSSAYEGQDLPAPEETKKAIPEILVKGSNSLNMDIRRTPDDAQPYVVLDRETIERSGAQDLQGFLKQHLVMSTASFSPSQAGANINNSRINLRGLGSDETLILVDGRRLPSLALNNEVGQPDVNGIPLAAIERIEILPVTASGIYGGSATGGVVNIIMRRDYTGLETALTYGSSFDGGAANRRVDVSSGLDLEEGRTSIMFAASWRDADTLVVADREYAKRARAHVMSVNPAGILSTFLLPLGTTANIRSATGADLTLRNSGISLGSPITFVPHGYAGATSDGGIGLATNAGRFNLELAQDNARTGDFLTGGGQQALLNSPTVKSLSVTLRREFRPWLETFVDLAHSENTGHFVQSANTNNINIAAGVPGNPFNQAIRVTTPWVSVEGATDSTIKSDRLTGGVIASIAAGWNLEMDYTWGRTKWSNTIFPRFDVPRLQADISSGALDVFRDTSEESTDFSTYLRAPTRNSDNVTTLKDATLRVSGPIPFHGFIPTLSLLTEHREEALGAQYSLSPTLNTLFPESAQTVDSIYAEFLLPLVANTRRRPGLELVELQIAVRYDRYESHGGSSVNLDQNLVPLTPVLRNSSKLESTDPTFALRYQPLRDIVLRGSFGTGFLPPSAGQLAPTRAPNTFTPTQRDPRRGNEPLGTVIQSFAGVQTLLPEESESWSAGAIVTPRLAQGLRLSADWVRIRKKDNIATISDYLGNELFVPGLVTRNSDPASFGGFEVGPIVEINLGLFNIARLDVEAIDFGVHQEIDTDRFGTFEVAVQATKLKSLRRQVTPIAPVIENAGLGSSAAGTTEGSDAGGLTWKANGSVTWRKEGWTLSWGTRYFDGYFLDAAHTIVPNQGSSTVPSQTYHDIYGSYRFSNRGQSNWLDDTTMSFSVNNVFNARPPLDLVGTLVNPPGYSLFADPSGATYQLSISKSFGGH